MLEYVHLLSEYECVCVCVCVCARSSYSQELIIGREGFFVAIHGLDESVTLMPRSQSGSLVCPGT